MQKIILLILFLLVTGTITLLLYKKSKYTKQHYEIINNITPITKTFSISGTEKEMPIKSLLISGADSKDRDTFSIDGKKEIKLEIIIEDVNNQ